MLVQVPLALPTLYKSIITTELVVAAAVTLGAVEVEVAVVG